VTTTSESSGSSGDTVAGTGTSTDGTGQGSTSGSGTDPTSDGTTDASSTTGTTEGGESETTDPTMSGTPCPTSCLPIAPDGWFGPYVQAQNPAEQGEATGCGGDYPTSVWQGFGDVSAANASCGCTCGNPTGGSCEDPITIRIYDRDTNGNGCTNVTVTIPSTDDYLDDDGNAESGINVRIDEPEVEVAPTCDPSASESVPAYDVSDLVELCSGAAIDGDCESGELCLPDFSADVVASHCIWTEGSVPCPVGTPYSQAAEFFEGVNDTRGCSDCSCGAAQGTDCNGSVGFALLYGLASGGAVVDPVETEPANGTCRQVIPNQTVATGAQVAYGINYTPNSPTSSGCSPNGGAPEGAAVGTDMITVCCTP
jgi:hypothetical protein